MSSKFAKRVRRCEEARRRAEVRQMREADKERERHRLETEKIPGKGQGTIKSVV